MSECHTVMLDDEGLEPDNGEQGQTGEEGEKSGTEKEGDHIETYPCCRKIHV